jgi:hypothetical protein
MFCLCFLLASLFAFLANAVSYSHNSSQIPISVRYDSDSSTFVTEFKYDDSFDAFGYYSRNNSGWNNLKVEMQAEISSSEEFLLYAKAFGYLEGFVSCEEIFDFYPNFYSSFFGKSEPEAELLKFLTENLNWVSEQSSKLSKTDSYWFTVKSILTQMEGMLEGFSSGCASRLNENQPSFATLNRPSLMHFYLLNSWRDLPQILAKFHSLNTTTLQFQRGSSFVKVLEDRSDVIFGHSNWNSYELAGPRVFKQYSFPLMRNGYAERHFSVQFSSFPGVIASVDNFLVSNGYSRLVLLETGYFLHNEELLHLIVPSSVLSWVRNSAAIQLATSGENWPKSFSKYSSGTSASSWMILDLNRFSSNGGIQTNFFTLYEEIPGYTTQEDLSLQLTNRQFWASYNVPYFQEIAVQSGYAGLCMIDNEACYSSSSRAQLFNLYHPYVSDEAGGMWLISYNSYQNDSASAKNPCKSISCRGDLLESDFRKPYGAIDGKVSSVSACKRKPGINPTIYGKVGPTHDLQPIFCWSDFHSSSEFVHNGQPNCLDFGWISLPASP